MADLTLRDSHFDFGKNWAEYSTHITPARIDAAVRSIRRLIIDIADKTFLDIGSGSGLMSLAALRLGAKSVTAIDIDEDSVATTTKVLERYAPDGNWRAEHRSVFDLPDEKFDVVYSWGVLHHTGAMWKAIERASRTVAPGGAFAFSLYEKTPLCSLWKFEKRLYVKAPKRVQRGACRAYEMVYGLGRMLTGKGRRANDTDRGFTVDSAIPDWMGGWPYESTTFNEVDPFMRELGFTLRAHNPVKVHAFGALGTGCTEYLYVVADLTRA